MFAIRVSKGSPAERVDVGTIAAAAGPALFLIPQQHAEELVGRRGFVDRNTKHPRRDLASYLLRGKGDRIPVLRGEPGVRPAGPAGGARGWWADGRRARSGVAAHVGASGDVLRA